MIDDRTIREWWDVFHGGSPLTEIRVMYGGKVSSGYFTDVETLLGALRELSEDCAVYATLNQVKESCYGRSQHDKFIRGPKSTTTDADVESRRWVLVDIDPVRPSDTNSSDKEKELADALLRRIYKYLRSEGFSDPVVADSANGYHLYYAVEAGNTQETTTMVKEFLRALDIMFSDEKVSVDTSVYNASRIVKVIGTASGKGTSTKTRPRRQSKFIHVPDEIRATDMAFFEKVAGFIPAPERPSRQNGYDTSSFDVEDFLKRNGIKVVRRSRFSGGEKLVLAECPFDANHKDSAILKLDNGAIAFKCFHNSCSQFGWRDFRLRFDPGAYSRREYELYRHRVSYNSRRADTETQQAPSAQDEAQKGNRWLEMTDIVWEDPSAMEHICTGITDVDRKMAGLYLGDLTIVSGLSGAGKTTLLNTLILSAVHRGYKVAAWSGELKGSRFQWWIDQQAAGRTRTVRKDGYEDFYFVPKAISDKIHSWLAGKLYLYNNVYGNDWSSVGTAVREIVRDRGVKLVVLDNLMAMDLEGPSGDNDAQTRFIKELHNIAERENIHVVLVCHPRKEHSFQLLRKDSIAGTANLTNLCDNLLIVHRVGRDFERRATEFFGRDIVDTLRDYDLVAEIAKNRSHGVVDALVGLYYEKESRRILNSRSDFIVYGWDDEPILPPPPPASPAPLPEFGDIPDDIWYNNY